MLNFVNAPQHRAADWRAALARLGLHAVVEFDTVAPALDGERQLYARLAVLLDRHAAALTRLSDALARQRQERRAAAFELLADLLIDVAALRLSSPNDADALAAAAERLRALARQREQACVTALLALYNFRPSDIDADALPLQGERWGMDLFHPQALKDMGLQLGMARRRRHGRRGGGPVQRRPEPGHGHADRRAAGGLWQGVEKLGKRVAGKLRGWREISVDDAVLRLLALRQRELIAALEHRGHAARTPIRIVPHDGEDLRKGALPSALKEARSRPEWSALGQAHEDSERRKLMLRELARTLSADAPATS